MRRTIIIPHPQYIRADIVGGIDPLLRPAPRELQIDEPDIVQPTEDELFPEFRLLAPVITPSR